MNDQWARSSSGRLLEWARSSDELIVSDDDESPKHTGRPLAPTLDIYVGRYNTVQHSPSAHSPSWNDDDTSRHQPWDTPIHLSLSTGSDNLNDPLTQIPSPVRRGSTDLSSPAGTPHDEVIELSGEEDNQEDSCREVATTPLVLNCSPVSPPPGCRWRRLEAYRQLSLTLDELESAKLQLEDYNKESWSEREGEMMALMEAGRFEKAVSTMENWLAGSCSEAAAVTMQYRLALCHRELNNFEQMEKCFNELLALPEDGNDKRPPQAHLYSCLGNAYLQWEKFPEAVVALEQCYRLRKQQLGVHDAKTVETRERLAEAQRAVMTRTL